jgi:hypothetical protein
VFTHEHATLANAIVLEWRTAWGELMCRIDVGRTNRYYEIFGSSFSQKSKKKSSDRLHEDDQNWPWSASYRFATHLNAYTRAKDFHPL